MWVAVECQFERGSEPVTVWVHAESWGDVEPDDSEMVDGVPAVGDALRLEAEWRGVRLSKTVVNLALRRVRFVEDDTSIE